MPTHILGINAFHADASAVLLRDGEVVAAIAEERLNRVKHFAGFPKLAVLEVLRIAGIDVDAVDHLAIGRDSKANLMRKLAFALTNVTRVSKLARQRLENRAQVRDVPALVAAACGVNRSPWRRPRPGWPRLPRHGARRRTRQGRDRLPDHAGETPGARL